MIISKQYINFFIFDTGKKVFSYTTPLLLYNISQGRLHRLSITEDEMKRRTNPPEKLNLRALQALLQTHKKKQWKQNLKNKMLDSSITVNEGQSGYLTAFTRLSEGKFESKLLLFLLILINFIFHLN